MISRNPDEYMRDTKRELHKMKRNYDPELHPMESARKSFVGGGEMVLLEVKGWVVVGQLCSLIR